MTLLRLPCSTHSYTQQANHHLLSPRIHNTTNKLLSGACGGPPPLPPCACGGRGEDLHMHMEVEGEDLHMHVHGGRGGGPPHAHGGRGGGPPHARTWR